jgi:hypothetical protein
MRRLDTFPRTSSKYSLALKKKQSTMPSRVIELVITCILFTLSQLTIMLNRDPVDALSTLVHRSRAYDVGKELVTKAVLSLFFSRSF